MVNHSLPMPFELPMRRGDFRVNWLYGSQPIWFRPTNREEVPISTLTKVVFPYNEVLVNHNVQYNY